MKWFSRPGTRASRIVLGSVLAVLALLPIRLRATDALDVDIERFARYLDALRVQAKIPGLSATILQDGAVRWEQGFGDADVEHQIAATPDTPYRLGGLTQMFSAMLALQCEEIGKLDIDVPIAYYSAAIPEATARVRHVLTHTSQGTPGAVFAFSLARFATLTNVVETCDDQPFRQAVARRLLDRLAMRATTPGEDLASPDPAALTGFDGDTIARYQNVLARVATGYTLQADGRVRPAPATPNDLNASVGLVSTVRDLAQFERALGDGTIISAAAVARAWQPATGSSGILPAGLGWFSQSIDGVRVVWQFGQWNQHAALYMTLPDRHTTLIVLANSAELNARFALDKGDLAASPFAKLFLRVFA